jgi:uncharacterized coiled-coil DUF342 family protein
MKSNAALVTALVVLILLCAGLGITLVVTQKKTVQQQKETQEALVRLTNDLMQTSSKWTSQVVTNMLITTNLVQRTEEVKALSNELVTTSAELVKTKAEAKAAAQTAQDEMAKQNARINDLETQKDELTKRMTDLSSSITNLETQIAATEKKLASSEGDRTFLLKELKRLRAEKDELEKQLNSLAFLRDQVRKVKEELSISRRLDWIRRGLYGVSSQKGGERLQQGFSPPAVQTNYNLNVEIRQDGAVKVVPAATNAPSNPAVTNKPAAK